MTGAERFGLVGAVNTAFGLLTIFAAKHYLGLEDIGANAFGYVAGTALGFALNRRWTFRFEGSFTPALMRYSAVMVTAYLANLVAMLFARDVINLSSHLAHVVAIVPYAVVGYVGCKYFAFREDVASTN